MPSNSVPIAVDLPLASGPIEVKAVCDAITFAPNRLDLRQGHWLTLWIEGLPENADRNNVRVYLNGRRLKLSHVQRGGAESRQVNADVPPESARGAAQIGVEVGGRRSNIVDVEING